MQFFFFYRIYILVGTIYDCLLFMIVFKLQNIYVIIFQFSFFTWKKHIYVTLEKQQFALNKKPCGLYIYISKYMFFSFYTIHFILLILCALQDILGIKHIIVSKTNFWKFNLHMFLRIGFTFSIAEYLWPCSVTPGE